LLICQVFKIIDLDKNGTIEREELYRMVKLLKPKFAREELSKVFNTMDESNDYRIQKEEFAKYYLEQFKADSDVKFSKRLGKFFWSEGWFFSATTITPGTHCMLIF